MPDFPSFLASSGTWSKFLDAVKKGVFPSAMAFVLAQDLQRPLLKEAARYWLCESGSACGECPSCRAWSGDGHPDLIVPSYDKEPSVDECRSMSSDLYLKPVAAPRRIGAVFFAENLKINASNSLLKLTEEPPKFSHVFFFMEKDSLIPTLRSRVWSMVFLSDDIYPAKEIPKGGREWLDWISRIAGMDRSEITEELRGFHKTLVGQGRLRTASELSQLIHTANQTNLSSAMMGDMAFLLIEEDYPFERFFDGFR